MRTAPTPPGQSAHGAAQAAPGAAPAPATDWYAQRVAALQLAMRSWPVAPATGAALPPASVDPFQGIVPSSINAVIEARHAFSEDGRSLITTTLLLFSASGALLLAPLAASTIHASGLLLCYALAGVCFGLVWPVTGVLRASAEAGYELYVSNTLSAAIVHRAAGIGTVQPVTECKHEDGYCEHILAENRLPHPWLDGIEIARNRLQVFTDTRPALGSRVLDLLFRRPRLREGWGNVEAHWPADHQDQMPRVAQTPRELTAAWINNGTNLLYCLRQLVSVARALATIGIVLCFVLTAHHLRTPLADAAADAQLSGTRQSAPAAAPKVSSSQGDPRDN